MKFKELSLEDQTIFLEVIKLISVGKSGIMTIEIIEKIYDGYCFDYFGLLDDEEILKAKRYGQSDNPKLNDVFEHLFMRVTGLSYLYCTYETKAVRMEYFQKVISSPDWFLNIFDTDNVKLMSNSFGSPSAALIIGREEEGYTDFNSIPSVIRIVSNLPKVSKSIVKLIKMHKKDFINILISEK
jgi:hypothetical protein